MDDLLATLLTIAATHPPGPLPLPNDANRLRTLYDHLRREAASDRLANNPDQVNKLVALAWAIAHQTGDPEHTAQAHWIASNTLWEHDPQQALQHAEHAYHQFADLHRSSEQHRVAIGYGFLLGQQGRLAEAEALYQTISTHLSPDYAHWYLVWLNWADLAGRQGNYAQMYERAERAAVAARAQQAPDFEAMGLLNQAVAALGLAQLAPARTLLEQAAAIVTYAPDAGRILLNQARLSTSTGHLFSALRQLQAARQHFQQAAAALEQATADIEEALVFEDLGIEQRAAQLATRAAQQFAAAGFPTESVEAGVIALRTALQQQWASPARQLVQTLQPQLAQVSARWQALITGYAAHLVLQEGQAASDHAFAQADAAARTLHGLGVVADALTVDLIVVALAQALGHPDATARCQQVVEQAQAYALHQVEQQALTTLARLLPPESARPLLERAVHLAEQEQRRMPAEALKSLLLQGRLPIYRQLIQVQLADPAAALHTLLVAKGGLWNDLAAAPTERVPDPTWLRARAELARLTDERMAAPSDQHQTYDAPLQQACEAVFQASLTAYHPRPARPLPTLAQLVEPLPPRSMLLDYVLVEEHIHVCVLRADQPPTRCSTWPRCPLQLAGSFAGAHLCGAAARPAQHGSGAERRADHVY